MKISSLWSLIALLIPAVGICGQWEDLKAAYARETDEGVRRPKIIAEANAPTFTVWQQVVTNVAPSNVVTAVQQLAALATNVAPIIAQVGLNYQKLEQYSMDHASTLTEVEALTLFKMKAVWEPVAASPHLADGMANFRPVIVVTNLVSAQGPSIAVQAIGHAATEKDFQ